MRKNKFLVFSLLLCLSLVACGQTGQETPKPPVETPPVADVQPELPADDEKDRPVELDHLTVEVVVDWSESERILGELENLSALLQGALAEQGCEVDEITVTISTAGGFTGGALAEGGVDIALLPAVDYVAWEDGAVAILTTTEEIPTGVIAVTAAREELDQNFRETLAAALLQSRAGADFLTACCPNEAYVAVAEESLQKVRDWAAQQELTEGEG